ncbi:hypothetical protein COBT_001201 [Conglomerata obtusa]
MTKPENDILPPQLHYRSSKSYALSSRLNKIQRQITQRCLKHLEVENNALILDLGCGTGISGREISRNGYMWIGCDISRDMLNEAVQGEFGEDCISDASENSYQGENEYRNNHESLEDDYSSNQAENNIENNYGGVNNTATSEKIFNKEKMNYVNNNDKLNDKQERFNNNIYESNKESNLTYTNTYEHKNEPVALLNLDIANTLPFRPGSFDAVISVSCIQWLFHNRNLPESRLAFKSLFFSIKSVLKIKGMAVIQFYNLHKDHLKIINEEAQKAGFFSSYKYEGEGRNKKCYLILDYKNRENKKEVKKVNKVREEIQRRKDRRIKKGLRVARDSKYTGRKRCKKFI